MEPHRLDPARKTPCHLGAGLLPVGYERAMLNIRKLLARLKAGQLEFDLFAGLFIKGSGAVASVALTLLVSRLYGPDGVGMFQIALTTSALLAVAASFGLDKVVVRSVSVAWSRQDLGSANGSISRALRVTGWLGAVMAVLMAALAYPLTYLVMGQPAVFPALLVMALTVPALALIRVMAGSIRCLGKVFLAQSLDGIAYTGLTAGALGLAWLVFGRPPALTPEVLYTVACMGVAVFGWRQLAALRQDWPQGTHSLSLRSGGRIAAIIVMGLAVEWLVVIALGGWKGPAEAGIFRVAAQFGLLFTLVRNSFDQMVAPRLATHYAANDRPGMNQILLRSSLIGAGLCLPLLGALLVFPQWLLGLFGAEFQRGSTALMILAAGQFVGVAAGPVGALLDMAHREYVAMRIEIGIMLGSIAMLVLLVPEHGMIGAAVTFAAATVARSIALWIGALVLMRGMAPGERASSAA